MTLQGSVVVVTGASRGIGREAALAFARAGADVVCTARTTKDTPAKLPGTIEETAERIRALGRRALAVQCDVSREDQVDALAKRTMAEFGGIDILINNAAVNFGAPIAGMSMKRWDLILNVNLRGTVLCTKAVLPRMIEQASGRVINVSSGAADPQIAASFAMVAYGTSKAAVETFTQGLALEVQPHDIAVNCLRIETYVATEGAMFFNPGVDFSDWDKPDETAELLLWLATRDRSYTGHVLTLADARAAMAREG